MKKITWCMIMLALILSCSKEKETEDKVIKETKSASVEKKEEYLFIRNYTENGFVNFEDTGKDVRLLDKSKYKRLNFADKLKVIEVKYMQDDEIVKTESSAGDILWFKKENLVNGFAVVNKESRTYSLPFNSYSEDLRLNPGDLGFLYRKHDKFVNADFRFFTINDSGNRVYAGNRWVESDSVITDIDAARQALFIYYAKINFDRGNNRETANFLQMAEKVSTRYHVLNQEIIKLKRRITAEEPSNDE